MSVISKDLAGQVATKLTEKSRISSEKLHLEYRELTTLFYEQSTPDEVKKCFKKNPEWFYTRSSIRLHGNGFNYEYITPTRPVIANSNSEAILQMDTKTANKIMDSMRKWQDAVKKYKELKEETKQALLTLKTYNNIKKEMPLAAPMLPPPLSNALVVNFDSLKKRLEKQPEVKKESVQ